MNTVVCKLALAVGGLGCLVHCPARAATFTVTALATLRFSPTNLTIHVGDTVTWNGLGTIHTVTGDTVPDVFCGTAHTCTRTFNTQGTFPYHCIPHQSLGMVGSVIVVDPNAPPTVSVTSPTNGTAFPAPASFTILAQAAKTGGSVTNVEFFRDTVSLGSDVTSPFSVEVTALPAGNYTLTARATDNGGLRATSPPVSIRVLTPAPLRIVNAAYSPMNVFSFDYSATPGLRYVVQQSEKLAPLNWLALETNTATGTLEHFSRFLSPGPLPPPASGYYRVFIQP